MYEFGSILKKFLAMFMSFDIAAVVLILVLLKIRGHAVMWTARMHAG